MGKNIRNFTNFFKQIKNYCKKTGAFSIVLKYGIFGILWILLSDYALYLVVGDYYRYRNIQIVKGWIYVIVTMALLFILINKNERRIKSATNKSFKAQKELDYIAYYDTLTGLPNRTMFINKITQIACDEKTEFAIAFVDIDNFKYINDTLGHNVGDEFLKYISNKISFQLIFPDMVARLGGDEFAILIENYETREELYKKLDYLKCNLGNAWNYDGQEFFISVSIGVVFYPVDGQNFDTLLKHSDVAMYDAKIGGKNKISFYEKHILEKSNKFIHMSNKLQKGLANKEFEMYYQPQIQLLTGKLIGVEALVRWNHFGEGFIPPSEFIIVAEKTGQIYELENRIIRSVLTQKKLWENAGFINIEVSFNLSSKSLTRDTNFRQIEGIINEFDIDYSCVVVEITETAVISNMDLAIERLNILKKKGFKIALDDFGTGYSSLTYLRLLPIDIVKLDQSYVNLNDNDYKNVHISKFIISMADKLGFKVIAEGVETEEQLKRLIHMGCEYGQGYFLGKPMDVNNINILINENLLNHGLS